MNLKNCVYTTLIGDYEELLDYPLPATQNIDYICLTDNVELQSKHWQIRHIKPVLFMDLPRSSRHPKILPHLHLHDYEVSLYIDNTVRLRSDVSELFQPFTDNPELLFALNRHSFHDSIGIEFSKVREYQLDSSERVNEQLNAYLSFCPEVFNEPLYWAGFMLRRHNHPKLIETMEIWWQQVLRYSRRDQLSLNYSLLIKPINVMNLNLDNNESKYHEWPAKIKRERLKYIKDARFSELNLSAQVKELQLEIAKLKDENELLQKSNTFTENLFNKISTLEILVATQAENILLSEMKIESQRLELEQIKFELHKIRSSRSWKLTAPIRDLGNSFRAIV